MASVHTALHVDKLIFYQVSSSFLTQFGYTLLYLFMGRGGGGFWRPVFIVGGCTTFNMFSISIQQMPSFWGQQEDSDVHLGCKGVLTVITFFHFNSRNAILLRPAGGLWCAFRMQRSPNSHHVFPSRHRSITLPHTCRQHSCTRRCKHYEYPLHNAKRHMRQGLYLKEQIKNCLCVAFQWHVALLSFVHNESSFSPGSLSAMLLPDLHNYISLHKCFRVKICKVFGC
jgi:hypothetical protein